MADGTASSSADNASQYSFPLTPGSLLDPTVTSRRLAYASMYAQESHCRDEAGPGSKDPGSVSTRQSASQISTAPSFQTKGLDQSEHNPTHSQVGIAHGSAPYRSSEVSTRPEVTQTVHVEADRAWIPAGATSSDWWKTYVTCDIGSEALRKSNRAAHAEGPDLKLVPLQCYGESISRLSR